MRPDARAQSAIEILDQWLQGDIGVDRILTQWARNNRYAGSKDRAAVADHVYAALRRLKSASWVAGGTDRPDGRALLHGCTVLDNLLSEELFTGARHAPAPLSEAEVSARRELRCGARPDRLDYPEWLEPYLEGVSDHTLDALRDRASLDLRVNTLKATRDQATQVLAEDGIEARPLEGFPNALRVSQGARKVNRSRAFDQGFVEIQDAGSQGLSDLARAMPGELIIDLCAGGGGKSLALAASAAGKARILAHDVSAKRLSDLPDRAKRAGAKVEIASSDALQAFAGKADLVFVDAPCSGSGAWRRNPDAKWQLTEQRLEELAALQSDLVRQATDYCNPDGRIVYGTCSILNIENQAQIDRFLEGNTEWKQIETYASTPADEMDGFFGAVLAR